MYENNLTLIPTNLVMYEPKTRIIFLGSWWFGNKKCFGFFIIVSSALLQRHAKFNTLINFIKEFCLYIIPICL